jgi:hypothetical protein
VVYVWVQQVFFYASSWRGLVYIHLLQFIYIIVSSLISLLPNWPVFTFYLLECSTISVVYIWIYFSYLLWNYFHAFWLVITNGLLKLFFLLKTKRYFIIVLRVFRQKVFHHSPQRNYDHSPQRTFIFKQSNRISKVKWLSNQLSMFFRLKAQSARL